MPSVTAKEALFPAGILAVGTPLSPGPVIARMWGLTPWFVATKVTGPAGTPPHETENLEDEKVTLTFVTEVPCITVAAALPVNAIATARAATTADAVNFRVGPRVPNV